MSVGRLGQEYPDGAVLVRQGEVADRMFVIQAGEVEIVVMHERGETVLRRAGPGEIIGEMGLVERDVRSATVRARGTVRALTVEKRNFLRQVAEDPSVALHLVQIMSRRIRELSDQVVALSREPGDDGPEHA